MLKKKILDKIELIDFHSSGKSYGKLKNRSIYTENGIPGEIINIEIPRRVKQGNFTQGRILQFYKYSDERETPFCRHFDQCGGCNWQHIKYIAQLKWKRQILINAFKKYNIYSPEIPLVIKSPKILYYRNKSEYTFKESGITNLPLLGFHIAGSHTDIINIDECFLQDFNDKINFVELKRLLINWNISNQSAVKSLTFRTTISGEMMIVLNFNEINNKAEEVGNIVIENFPKIDSLYYSIPGDIELNLRYFHVFGKKVISEKAAGIDFNYGPDSFYQPNPLQAENIYNKIVEFAQLSGNEFIYDLYTGVGTIACILAKHALKVIGIEGSENAILNAINNALANNIRNVEFITGDILKTFTPVFVEKNGKADIIVLDPPRSGTLVEIKKTILWTEPSKIIYLSCNPVSLAWDLKQLSEKYEITRIQPFDMFPNTHHLETLVLMELRK